MHPRMRPDNAQQVDRWHDRFTRQAAWTEQIRSYLLAHLPRHPAARVLEVGCGTGVITRSLLSYAQTVCGLDLDTQFLRFAARSVPGAHFTCGDALAMPFPGAAFDAVVCHFFLLWTAIPAQALAEMARVTRPGGTVIAFAEPDYGGRIDYPPPLDELGRLQAEGLRRQGADPEIGRKLSGLFHVAGLREIETGLLGGQWKGAPSPAERQSEWDVLANDLKGSLAPQQLDELREIDAAAWASGERVLFVPTFYAFGVKP